MDTYKTLKLGLLFIALTIITPFVKAQDYTTDLIGIQKVYIESETTIVLKSHDLDQLLINEIENFRTLVPEKANGLQSFQGQGSDNTGYGVAVSKGGSALKLTGLRDRRTANLVVYVPKNMDVSLKTLGNNDLIVTNFISEIEAKTYNGDIYLYNVTGPIIAESKVGNINVLFDEINQSSPISIISSNGDVDITLPENSKADLTIRTPRGELYTDFDLLKTESNADQIVERRTLQTKLNGGGVLVILQTLKGNLFLRKK